MLLNLMSEGPPRQRNVKAVCSAFCALPKGGVGMVSGNAGRAKKSATGNYPGIMFGVVPLGGVSFFS